MFDGLKNSIKSTTSTSKRASNEIIKMAKEMPKMPWEKLNFVQWAYIIFGTIALLLIAFVLIPLLNL